MARRASAVAANSAMRGYGNQMNRQGAATPPGSTPSPLLTDIASGVGVPQRVNQTGGWGDVYGYLGLPRQPQSFTDAAFGPFSPILSVPINEPQDNTGQTPARRLPYRVGWNLPVGEPGTEGLKLADFGTLRTLADLYSVARACVDYLKSEISALEWDILPTKAAAGAMRNSKAAAIDFGKRQGEALKFLRRPDPNFATWQSWMMAMLEEELVYDALSLVVVPTWGKGRGRGRLGSDLQNVVLVSGATIRPLYDVRGWSPRPPNVAYQQYLYGVPRSDWMNIITDQDIEEAGLTGQDIYRYRGSQLMYLPRNPRTWTPYGQSCIEKALLPIITGLARQGWQNDYYKEGTVPAVYISPGADMSPAQIRELQNALNGIAGDPAYHHKIIVLPPNSKVDPQRSTPLADQFDEIIMLQVCCVPGTEIMTRDGLKVIENVQVGDQVLTHKGRWRTVTKTMANPVHSPVRRITANGFDPLEVTGNHPVWAAQYTQTSTHCQRYQDTDWTAAEDLRSKKSSGEFHALTLPIPQTGPANAVLTIADHVSARSGRSTSSLNRLPSVLPMNAAFGRLLGFYMAEGSTTGSQTAWYFHENETTYQQQVIDDLWSVFGLRAKITPVPDEKCVRVTCSSVLLSELLNCGTAMQKRLPPWAWDGSREFYEALLWAWVAGDGTLRRTGWRGYTTSRTLAWQMRLVALACGHEPQLRTQMQSKSVIKGRPINGQDHIYVVEVVLNKQPGRRGTYRIDGPHLTSPVRSNELSEYAGDIVYNLEVEEDESYVTTGGCTHNCMGFGVQPTQIGIIPQVSTAVSPSAAKQMSQMAGEAQARATQKPRLLFYMWLMDYILQELCGQEDMRFVFAGMQEESDEKTETDLVVNQMSHAIITIDEGREKLGLVPYGTKESTEPGFLTATGWIPLAQAAQQSTALAGMSAQGPSAPQGPTGNGDKPSKPPTKPGPGGKPASGGAAQKPAAGNTGGAPGTRTSRAANGIKPNNPTTPGHELRAAAAKKSAGDDEDEQQDHDRERDEAIVALEAVIVTRLVQLMLSVSSGTVPMAEAVQMGTDIMRHGYSTLMTQASQAAARDLADVEPMAAQDIDALAAVRASNQQPFLMGMAQDAAQASQTGESPTWLPARAKLYSETMRPAWEHAYGRTAAIADPTTKIIWHLGEAEHCPLCIARDGQEYTIDTLPCWPGDGGFGECCLGGPNCKCWLEFKVGDNTTGIGENLRREAGYFQQQRSTITARRAEARQQRDAFIAELPNTPGSDGTSARSRAQSREDLRRKLADLANRRIQQGGGYPGVSVEPADIPAKLIAGILGQYGEDAPASEIPITALMNAVESMYTGKLTEADMTKAAFTAAMTAAVVDLLEPHEVRAELEALTRHALKGRAPSSWDPQHLTPEDIAVVADLIKSGLDDRDMIVTNALRLRRRVVNIDGEVLSPDDTSLDEPMPVRRGDASGGGGPVLLPHDANDIYHDVYDLTRVGKGADHSQVVAGGLLVHAADTGRILMLQRHLGDETKDAAGQWELPGGRREEDETPLKAAIREWEEETGLKLPDGELTGAWASPNGRYHGYVHTIAREEDLPILDGRDEVRNPDDPDGDSTEALAWWDPDHLDGNPAVRDELHDDLDLLHAALRKKKPIDPDNVTAAQVYTQLLRNFPPKAIAWVKDCRWIGPIQVPLDQFDTQDREKWAASHQPERVQHFADKLKAGKPVHPIVAVKEPGQDTLIIVDGHHRYGGAELAKQKADTYIGLVDHDGGPWDETHSAQLHQGSDQANKSHGHGGDAETLREYWTHEDHPGPTHFAFEEEIAWGTPGDFNRCTDMLMEHGHMSEEQAHGYCNLRHHEALGYWPAQHARMLRGDKKS